MKNNYPIVFILVLLLQLPLLANKTSTDSTALKQEAQKSEKSVTDHLIQINGKTIKYTATAGTLILKDKEGNPEASMDYFAYVAKDGNEKQRPITFAFNGGPGSSSIWLHMGAFGPKRIVIADTTQSPPPPYDIVDNEFSILDKSDLVMIDPVGTGFSKALGKKKNEDFWGVDADIESLSNFIKQYVSENGRWNSPKYIIGESYGTTRGAGIVNYLQSSEHMSFNGIVLMSTAMDITTLSDGVTGQELPYALYLPTYTAVAWYHHKLPDQNSELIPLLQKVREFALGDYIDALLKGNSISEQERNDIAEKLHEYTGLPKNYVLEANLRIQEGEFTQELLHSKRETVGRIDARFKGFTFDPLSQYAEYDPLFPAVSPAFTAAFLDYIHNDLNFGKDMDYSVLTGLFGKWKWKHSAPNGEHQFVVNTSVDLAYAIGLNPYLKVLVMQGYFDLATPFLATEYTFSHMNISRQLESNVEIKYYQAGHMMYIHKPSLEKMKQDLNRFYDETDRIK
ncbi:MAG: hypothetical protein WCE54_10745 [Ignavibacteriaceae bacterium]